MLEKSFGLRELVASVAGPRTWSDTREQWLARAARRIGISFRQTRSLYYGEINDPNHRSARLLRDAVERRAQAEEDGRKEALENISSLLAMRDALAAKDAAFHQPEIDALEHALRHMVGDVGARAVQRNQRHDREKE